MKQGKVALLLLASALPGLAAAHGGEDHGEKPAPTAQVQGVSAGAMGDTFEVLVKAAESEPNEATALHVFISDARTNAPLKGAEVELSFLGASEVKLPATPSGSEGIYEASTTFPSEGQWEAMATVRRGSATEVLSLGPWKVEEAHHEHEEAEHGRVGVRTGVFALLGLGVAGAALWTVRRMKKTRREPREVPDAR